METIGILTWNLENLFNPKTGGPRYDHTPLEGWTEKLYQKKVIRISEVLKRIISELERAGKPIIIGLTEIEDYTVAEDILKRLPTRFKVAKDPNFSSRYHDAIVIYDEKSLNLDYCKYHKVFERFDKGDVLQTDFTVIGTSEKLTTFCCHLKARPSNQYYTSMYREAVCDNIQTLIWKMHDGHKVKDQIMQTKSEDEVAPTDLPKRPNIIVMGDFNDEPHSKSLIEYLLATYDKNYVKNWTGVENIPLYNCSWEKMLSEKPGTLYYEKSPSSNWSMLDQIIVSPGLLQDDSKLKYKKNSFHIYQDYTVDERGVPFRTSIKDEDWNTIWQDGYSDHLPVSIQLTLS
jgi:hypothetical protein